MIFAKNPHLSPRCDTRDRWVAAYFKEGFLDEVAVALIIPKKSHLSGADPRDSIGQVGGSWIGILSSTDIIKRRGYDSVN